MRDRRCHGSLREKAIVKLVELVKHVGASNVVDGDMYTGPKVVRNMIGSVPGSSRSHVDSVTSESREWKKSMTLWSMGEE